MTLNSVKIECIIKEEINRLLHEELSISDDIKKTSKIIFDNISNGKFDFNFEFFECGEYNVVGIPTEVSDPSERVNGMLDVENAVIRFTVPIYGENIVTQTLYEEIYHEIEHLFQVSKMNGNAKKSYNTLYNLAIKQEADEKSNYYQRELARYVYCCSTLEQDAFVNGLYSELSNEAINKKQEIEIFKNSQAYKALNTIREVRSEIIEGNGNFGYYEAAKDYRKSLRWFVYLGDTAERRLKSKIKNVILKSRKDRLEKNIFPTINLDGIGR